MDISFISIQLPACFEGLGVASPACLSLRKDILTLAQSSSFRRRATWVNLIYTIIQRLFQRFLSCRYVKCAQSLVLSSTLGQQELSQSSMWSTLQILASDSITDVRIGTARVTSLIACALWNVGLCKFSYLTRRTIF